MTGTNTPTLRRSAEDIDFILTQNLKASEARYASQNPESEAAHLAALEFMPGGNTRSVLYNGPFPIYMKKGHGNRLWDVDGHECVYIALSLLDIMTNNPYADIWTLLVK